MGAFRRQESLLDEKRDDPCAEEFLQRRAAHVGHHMEKPAVHEEPVGGQRVEVRVEVEVFAEGIARLLHHINRNLLCVSAEPHNIKCMRFAFTVFAAAALSLIQADAKLPVASLSTVLTDVARNVGGDVVEVDAIIKLAVDPHDFTPTASDVKALSKAKVVLLSGNGMEDTYLGKLEKSVGAGPVFVPVGESIPPLLVEAGNDDHGHSHHGAPPGEKIPDPHWWQSIKNVATATEVVRDALIQADPANRTTYEDNAKQYLTRLTDLAKWARLEVARLPRSKRILVTSHDAFGYFARDYGFTLYPIEGITTDDQPSSKKVRAIIDAIKARGVKSIFLETIQNPKVLTEITRETGAKNGGELYADGLGPGADTYEKMIRHNYSTIVAGLE